MKVTIDRQKWARGFNSYLEVPAPKNTDEMNEQLSFVGHMCCLGFYAIACGVPRECIIGVGEPSDLDGEDKEKMTHLMTEDGDDDLMSKPIVADLIKVNDDPLITDTAREALIIAYGARVGIEFEFVN